jgi:predicted dehydrogenase
MEYFMSSIRAGLVAVLALALLGPALAGTYYVAQNQPGAADSNPGTEDQPWLTLGKAVATAATGDTVWIKAGTYREPLELKGDGVTVRAFGDEAVVLALQRKIRSRK